MDFAFTPDQERLRNEAHEWFRGNVPESLGLGIRDEGREEFEFAKSISKKLAEKGWLCLGWPVEYGGSGYSHFEQAIIREQMGYFRVGLANSTGLGLAGPAILIHGTEEQKKKYLPPIANADPDYIWCQGFTEPNAGSDLASLQTRAVQDGDYYVISGQKTYTSRAQFANYCYLMARTDPDAPKHRGITMFLVDLKLPGANVRPLQNMAGTQHQAELFLDEVRVPATDMIGEKNRGWYLAATTLDFERSGVGGPATQLHLWEEVVRFCKEAKSNGRTLISIPRVRNILAEAALDIEVWRLCCWRVAWLQGQGKVPSYETSMSNLMGKVLSPKFGNAYMNIVGLGSTLKHDAKWAPLMGRLEHLHRGSYFVHGQGASNIQRNIIAQRGLGLPR